MAGLIALVACGGDDPPDAGEPTVVAVAAQPCDSPNQAHGHGVVLADDLVATAAHTVDGDRRSLTVDDAAATVVAIDPRTDLALLAFRATEATTAVLSTETPATAVILRQADRQADRQDVDILSTGPLVVHDTTAGTRHRREVHRFAPGIDPGASGAPVIDERGRVLGIVVLANPGDGVGYAVTARELQALLALPRAAGGGPPGRCPGSPG